MDFGNHLKTTLLKTIEAFGRGASSLAEGAQKKLGEMNLEVRRHELAEQLPDIVMELYRSGAELPEALKTIAEEMSSIGDQLAAMRAEHAGKQSEEPQETEAEPTEESCEPSTQEETVLQEEPLPAEEEKTAPQEDAEADL